MSRSGYIDDFEDPLELGQYRGRVASAIRGKRGQAFLRRLVAALDAMPEKRLITDELRNGNDRCALGVVMGDNEAALALDPESHNAIGKALDIAPCLVAEVEYENDDEESTPERRWHYMRAWAVRHIKEPKP